jgi:hypothetical protein
LIPSGDHVSDYPTIGAPGGGTVEPKSSTVGISRILEDPGRGLTVTTSPRHHSHSWCSGDDARAEGRSTPALQPASVPVGDDDPAKDERPPGQRPRSARAHPLQVAALGFGADIQPTISRALRAQAVGDSAYATASSKLIARPAAHACRQVSPSAAAFLLSKLALWRSTTAVSGAMNA